MGVVDEGRELAAEVDAVGGVGVRAAVAGGTRAIQAPLRCSN